MSSENAQVPAGNCFNCSKPLMKDGAFCAYCGVQQLPPDVTPGLAAFIDGKLSARLKDQATMVREVADKAEDVVWKRFKGYAWITGIFVARQLNPGLDV